MVRNPSAGRSRTKFTTPIHNRRLERLPNELRPVENVPRRRYSQLSLIFVLLFVVNQYLQARFRVYGHISPVYPSNELELFDLAHIFAGGRVEHTSDQHFEIGSNLILPGRGKNMGGGWETKRSRQKEHKDWVIIKL